MCKGCLKSSQLKGQAAVHRAANTSLASGRVQHERMQLSTSVNVAHENAQLHLHGSSVQMLVGRQAAQRCYATVHQATLDVLKLAYLAEREDADCVLVSRAITSRTKGFVGIGKVPTVRLCPGSGALSTNTLNRQDIRAWTCIRHTECCDSCKHMPTPSGQQQQR